MSGVALVPDTICQEEQRIVDAIGRHKSSPNSQRKGIDMHTLQTQNTLFYRFFCDPRASAANLLATLKRIRMARRSRAVTRQLLTHDDRLLTDIGVSRNDVIQALHVAWDADPAVALAEIRRRRLQADRQGLVRCRVYPVVHKSAG